MLLVHPGHAEGHPAGDERQERARKIRPEYARGPLRFVAGGRHQAEAELIQNLLLEEGVPSLLRRSAGFDVPDFLAAGPRDVYVPESGATVARDVLLQSEMLEQPTAPAPFTGSRHAARLAAAVIGGGAGAALLAWALIRLTA